jgi:hypothetical protein
MSHGDDYYEIMDLIKKIMDNQKIIMSQILLLKQQHEFCQSSNQQICTKTCYYKKSPNKKSPSLPKNNCLQNTDEWMQVSFFKSIFR